jgi:hypothetical protein
MNSPKKISILLTGIIFSAVTLFIFSCNNKFPPPQPEANTYGEALWQIDHFITNDKAMQLINTFRQNKEGIAGGQFKGIDKLLFDHETFNVRDIATLLKAKGCIGLRINLGMDENKQVRLVLVAVDAKGKEIVTGTPSDIGRSGAGGGTIAPPTGKNYVETGQRNP